MATETLESRVSELESQMKTLMIRLAAGQKTAPEKRGWRIAVGIDANNPYFEEAVRLGREWRFADSPKEDEGSGE